MNSGWTVGAPHPWITVGGGKAQGKKNYTKGKKKKTLESQGEKHRIITFMNSPTPEFDKVEGVGSEKTGGEQGKGEEETSKEYPLPEQSF